MFLKQSTASQEIQLGPFIDDTDFITPETGLTIANTDIKLRKGGGTTHISKNSGGATHIANGYYYATLDATDTNTVGILDISVNETGALPVWVRFYVVEEVIFDALFAASAAAFDANQRVDLGSWLGNAVTASSGNPDVNVESIDDIDAPATWEASIVAAMAVPTAATVADAVWDEAISGHVGVGSFGEEVQAHALSSEITALNDPTAATIADAVWDEAKSGHVGVGSFGEEVQAHALSSEVSGLNDPTAATIADAVWDEAISGHVAGGSFGEEVQAHALTSEITALNDPTTAEIADKILGRSHEGGSDGTRSVAECLAPLRNKVVISGGTLTVYGADDTTVIFSGPVTTAAGDPVSEFDPT